MKKILIILVLCVSLLVNTGCSFVLIGAAIRISDTVTDPSEYGNVHDSVQIPFYYPESITEYTVNSYFYAIEKDTALCYEIFLDLTVSEDELTSFISSITSDRRKKTITDSYNYVGYKEIVFFDEYAIATDRLFSKTAIEAANIEKVLYSEENQRIIFVLLYIEENSGYHYDEIEYFKKLNIDPTNYKKQSN